MWGERPSPRWSRWPSARPGLRSRSPHSRKSGTGHGSLWDADTTLEPGWDPTGGHPGPGPSSTQSQGTGQPSFFRNPVGPLFESPGRPIDGAASTPHPPWPAPCGSLLREGKEDKNGVELLCSEEQSLRQGLICAWPLDVRKRDLSPVETPGTQTRRPTEDTRPRDHLESRYFRSREPPSWPVCAGWGISLANPFSPSPLPFRPLPAGSPLLVYSEGEEYNTLLKMKK